MRKLGKILIPVLIMTVLIVIIVYAIMNTKDSSYNNYVEDSSELIFETYTEPNWYIKDGIDSVGIEYTEYVYQKYTKLPDTVLPEWIEDEYVFYPEDGLSDASVYICLGLSEFDTFEKSDNYSRYDYSGYYVRVYTINGEDIVTLLKDNVLYTYPLSAE